MPELFTVGHSNHSIERFFDLLARHGISALADVRSAPFSRHTPQFNKDQLQSVCKSREITYVFLGRELGARREERGCYKDNQVNFDLVAAAPLFQMGLQVLVEGTQSFRVAVMCTEKDPITCHRMILVCRNLRDRDVNIRHILDDGSLESLGKSEARLRSAMGVPETDLFLDEQGLTARAYDLQAGRIAFVDKEDP